MPTQTDTDLGRNPSRPPKADAGGGRYEEPPEVSEATGAAAAWVLLLVLLVAALVGAFWLWTLSITTVEEATYQYEQVSTLQLDVGHGNVTVQPADGDAVTVHERTESTIRPVETDRQLHDDGTLTVSSQTCPTVAFAFFNRCSADYTISVPDGVDVAGDTRHGSITVSGVGADIDLTSRHGNLHLDEITGDVNTETGHGRIELRQVHGTINASTDHGRVNVDDVYGPVAVVTRHGTIQVSGGEQPSLQLSTNHGRIDAENVVTDMIVAQTNHGSVDLTTTTHPTDIDIRTSHGQVNLDLPADPPRYDVNASTRHGSEDINLPVESGADHRLHINTNHGSISVNSG